MQVNLDPLLNQTKYQYPRRVRDDVTNLCSMIRTLTPRLEKIVHNNGTETVIICLHGTIPIYYAGSQYNIPLDFHLYEAYPNVAPRIFVRPTSTMIIKPGHQNIDIEGGVFFPYLSDWSVGSTLVELVALLASLFSMDPPVYAKPPGYQPPNPPSRRPNDAYNTTPMATGYNTNDSVAEAYRRASYTNPPASTATATASAQSSYMPSGLMNPGGGYDTSYHTPVYATVSACTLPGATPVATPVGQQQQQGYAYQTGTSGGTYGATATATATGTPVGAAYGNQTMTSTSSSNKQSYDNYSSNYSGSNGAASSVGAIAATMSSTPMSTSTTSPTNNSQKHRSTMENELQTKLKKEVKDYFYKLKAEVDDELSTKWALQNSANEMNDILRVYEDSRVKLIEATHEVEEKMASLESWRQEMEIKKNQDVENYVVPYDDLSMQIIRLSADILAVDDAIYYLEKGLANSVIDLPTFLKETRNLARTQFLAKNHLMKINASLNQS